MVRYIVLGRFQPFHFGHAALVHAAAKRCSSEDELVIAIGSSQAGWEARNPWDVAERTEMIGDWCKANNVEATIAGVEDINDPPRWVEHAQQHHGEGELVTSDDPTAELYEAANWTVHRVQLDNRDQLEGWRVRQTIRMLSTVMDDDATREVLKETVPKAVIDWLITNDAMFRCSTFETGVHAG